MSEHEAAGTGEAAGAGGPAGPGETAGAGGPAGPGEAAGAGGDGGGDVGRGSRMPATEGLLHARAAVVHDLAAAGLDSPAAVDVVEDAVAGRRWWVERWNQGLDVVAGQIAQDVQDRLLDDTGVRWPLCHAPECDGRAFHSLAIVPELGPDPHWVCEEAAVDVAPLGRLPRQPPGPPELTGG